MKIHANARTCPNSRKLLVKRIEEEDWSLMVAAEAAASASVPSRLPADRGRRGAGHRVLGPGHRQSQERTGPKRSGATGWEFVHVCVDDATRLAYVEVLPDEKGATAAAFLRRAVSWLEGMGIEVERVLSHNGACYRSTVHAEVCAELSMRHLFTRPYRPPTNGKAERLIQTLTNRWPMEPSMAPRRSAPRHCPAGLITTTSGDDTAPSAINRPQLGSPSWNNVLSSYS